MKLPKSKGGNLAEGPVAVNSGSSGYRQQRLITINAVHQFRSFTNTISSTLFGSS
jgi:hypothetical protein